MDSIAIRPGSKAPRPAALDASEDIPPIPPKTWDKRSDDDEADGVALVELLGVGKGLAVGTGADDSFFGAALGGAEAVLGAPDVVDGLLELLLLPLFGLENMASRLEMPGMFFKCCGRFSAEPPADCSNFMASSITLIEFWAEAAAVGTLV